MANDIKKEFKPDLYVVARFLERLWTTNKQYKKTQLQMAVGLNYKVFLKYLNWLEEKNLAKLEKDNSGHTTVKITAEGVDAYSTLVKWIKRIINAKI